MSNAYFSLTCVIPRNVFLCIREKKKKKDFPPGDAKALSPDLNENPDLCADMPTPVTNGCLDMKVTDSKYYEEKPILRRNEITDDELGKSHLRDTVI